MVGTVFRIEKNDTLGNYMVANRNIKQGELILSDIPVMVGPQISGLLYCFNCFTEMRRDNYKICSNCNMALICNKDCEDGYHTKQECSHFKTLRIDPQKIVENHQIIFPLRCILLKKHSPLIFEKIVKMEAHLDARRNTTIWRRHKIAVEDVLRDFGVFEEEDFQEEMVQRICGILDVNTFEIRPKNFDNFSQQINPELQSLRGLYPQAAMMAHDCNSNVHLSVDENYVLTIHASVDIKEDDLILFNYAGVLEGVVERQRHLLEGKYFTCVCKRCRDPSEFGTEISSLRCHKCLKGLIRPEKSVWTCDACESSFSGEVIQLAVDEGVRRVEETDPTDIQALESLCSKLSLTFHPNHFVLLHLKQNMVALYSRLPLSTNNLNRKIDLCARLLSVFSKLEPGISRIRALTMYELQSAMVDLSNKQYRAKEINEDILVNELSTAEAILKDAVKNLLYEPTNSPEGKIAQIAMTELKSLRTSVKNIKQNFISHPSNQENNHGIRKNEVNKRLKKKLDKKKEEIEEDDKKNVDIKNNNSEVINDKSKNNVKISGKKNRSKNKNRK